MTFTYLRSHKDAPRRYGPILIAIADGQAGRGETTKINSAQKLTQNKGIISLGTGQGLSINEQNERIRELNGKVNNEYIINEFFPNICKFHYDAFELPNLLDPNVDPNKFDDNMKRRILEAGTTTYIAFKEGKGHNIFKLNLVSGYDYNQNAFVQGPSCNLFQKDITLPDGSGLETVGKYYDLLKLNAPPPEFSNSHNLDKRVETYGMVLDSIGFAYLAAKEKHVNEYFQIGILNNNGYNSIVHRNVSFNNDEEALNHLNSTLSTHIPKKDINSIGDILEGEKIVKEISDKFFANIDNFSKSNYRINVLRFRLDHGLIKKKDIDETNQELNEVYTTSFIPNKKEAYQSIDNLLVGRLHKLVNPNSEKGEKIKKLQGKYPKK